MTSRLVWHEAVEKARPAIFRIFTPSGSGSGFLLAKSATNDLIVVATALHVVEQANLWEQPIKLQHYESGKTFHLNESDRAIFTDEAQDTAAILFNRGDCDLTSPIKLSDPDKYLKVGVQIGWLGFPAVASGELCFFSGHVSSINKEQRRYLVDGVAINGVSGGPAIWIGANDMRIMGVLSAYIPNRSTGEALPGLAVVQDITQFHSVVDSMRSLDEAKEKESEVVPDTAASDGAVSKEAEAAPAPTEPPSDEAESDPA